MLRILLLLLLASGTTNAQQLFLKNYSIDDGLPSNEIYQVTEDKTGYLLIATDRGACRFDGYNFENISLSNRNHSTPVYYIYKTPKNEVYFSGLKGCIYQYTGNSLVDFPYNSRITSIFQHPGLLIANSVSQHNDSLWISYNNDYVFNFKIGSCVITKDGEVTKIKQKDGIYFDIPRKFFYRQLSVNQQQHVQPLYIKWDEKNETVDSVDLSWSGGYVRRLYYERMGDYDVLCIGKRLLIYKHGIRICNHLFPFNILSFARVDDRQFYLGFERGGAASYEVSCAGLKGPKQTVLKELSVTSVYKDSHNAIWFSTYERGLFYSYLSNPVTWNSQEKIECIERKNKKVYVGYRSGRVQVFSRNQLVQEYQLPLKRSMFLLHLSFDHKDSLLASTNKGFFRWAGNKWSFFPFSDILLLPVSKDSMYGASSYTPELHLYDGQARQQASVFLSKRIISLYHDSQKELWIGTWDGLYKLDRQGKLIDLSKINPVFGDRVVSISELSDHSLVIATLGRGLAVYKQGMVFNLTVSNGLTTPVINSLVVENDNIWLGTNKGINKVRFENDSFYIRQFGTEAGLPSMDVRQFTVADNYLYVKWMDRLVMICIEKLLKPYGELNTSLTAILVNDRKTDIAQKGGFRYNENSLTFQFNCINFPAAHKQKYFYKLEGLDTTWRSTTERSIKYISLPPGDYTFTVGVKDEEQNCFSNLAGYQFGISPPFWQRWWFKLAAVMIICMILVFGFKKRIDVVKKKNSLLLELADSRQQALMQLINPHFLFNVLNTLQSSVLSQDRLASASIISKYSKMIRLSLALSRDKFISLEKEISFLRMYLELEMLRTPDKFMYVIDVGESLSTKKITIPPMLIQPFVENAIKHGVAHLSDRKGCVAVTFKVENNTLCCTVEDNGIGREASANINKNINKEHKSAGIAMTLSRLKLVHQQTKTEFFYEVTDKATGSNSNGTIVYFSLPYIVDHEAN